MSDETHAEQVRPATPQYESVLPGLHSPELSQHPEQDSSQGFGEQPRNRTTTNQSERMGAERIT